MRSSFLALSAFVLALGGCSQSSPTGPATPVDAGVHQGDAATSTDSGLSQEGGDGGEAGASAMACNALTPAPSLLYVLFDTSSGMRDFFGSDAVSETLGGALASPLLATAREGLMYTPAAQSDCSSTSNAYASFSSGGVPFEPAAQGASDIASSVLSFGSDGGTLPIGGTSPWYIEAALAGAYSALETATAAAPINRRAVVLFADRDFDVSPPDCPAPHADAITESTTASDAGVETYVVYLPNADYPDVDGGVPGNPVSDMQALAHALPPGTAAFFNASDSSTSLSGVNAALFTVAADLGSCLYESPTGLPAGSPLAFTDYAPLLSNGTPTTVSVSAGASCTGDDANASPLYVVEGEQLRVCSSTCARLQASLRADLLITAQESEGRTTPVPLLPASITWDSPCAGDAGAQ